MFKNEIGKKKKNKIGTLVSEEIKLFYVWLMEDEEDDCTSQFAWNSPDLLLLLWCN